MTSYLLYFRYVLRYRQVKAYHYLTLLPDETLMRTEMIRVGIYKNRANEIIESHLSVIHATTLPFQLLKTTAFSA